MKKSIIIMTIILSMFLFMTGCAANAPAGKADPSSEPETEAVEKEQAETESKDNAQAEAETPAEKTPDTLQAPLIGDWVSDDSQIEEFSGAAGVNVSWSEVDGAQKYEYRFFFIAGGDSVPMDAGETEATNASCFFQDPGDAIRIQVRAIGESESGPVYSEWSTGELSGDDIMRISLE